MAYSKPYRESGLNEMALLASILWERGQQVARSSLFFFRSVERTPLIINQLILPSELTIIVNLGACELDRGYGKGIYFWKISLECLDTGLESGSIG